MRKKKARLTPEVLRLASNPATPSETLAQLFREQRSAHLAQALVKNPNLSPETLLEIAEFRPRLALSSPLWPLLFLEEPRLLSTLPSAALDRLVAGDPKTMRRLLGEPERRITFFRVDMEEVERVYGDAPFPKVIERFGCGVARAWNYGGVRRWVYAPSLEALVAENYPRRPISAVLALADRTPHPRRATRRRSSSVSAPGVDASSLPSQR